MKHITSIMATHSRDRGTWFLNPAFVLAAGFVIVWFIALFLKGITGEVFTGAVATVYFVVMLGGISAVTRTFPFAVGFSARRRDYVLGTLSMAVSVCAGWAVVLGLLSLVEADVIKNWVVGLHFFHLPWFSDGSTLRHFCWTSDAVCARADPSYVRGGLPLAQFWVYFILLLFMAVLGLLLGSIYQRFGRTGEYIFSGLVFLLLSVLLLVSTYWGWWGVIFGWLAGQTAAGFVTWLVLPMAFFALISYALLRKATV